MEEGRGFWSRNSMMFYCKEWLGISRVDGCKCILQVLYSSLQNVEKILWELFVRLGFGCCCTHQLIQAIHPCLTMLTYFFNKFKIFYWICFVLFIFMYLRSGFLRYFILSLKDSENIIPLHMLPDDIDLGLGHDMKKVVSWWWKPEFGEFHQLCLVITAPERANPCPCH